MKLVHLMKNEENHILHVLTQSVILPFLIAFFAMKLMPSANQSDIIAVSILGSLIPDIDHINIWLEYKFVDFRSFIRFLTKARRYRYSFLIFHNLGAMAVILLLIPIIGLKEPLAGLFLFAFLIHLVLDFVDDKISIRRVTHWRYRRKT
jgi:hypothetical protein